MIAAIIPARGGSKGIPRKNLVTIGGVQLIVRSIRHALGCPFIKETWVSTDDNDIAEVSEANGAKVFRRGSTYATDEASSDDAVREWLDAVYLHENREEPDVVVLLQATSPFRQPCDIDQCIARMGLARADSVFSARRLEGYTWTDNGQVTPNYQLRQPRQQRSSTTIEENGSIYVFKPWVLRQYGKRLGGKIAAYYQHPLDSFQLDSPEDIPLLETLASVRS